LGRTVQHGLRGTKPGNDLTTAPQWAQPRTSVEKPDRPAASPCPLAHTSSKPSTTTREYFRGGSRFKHPHVALIKQISVVSVSTFRRADSGTFTFRFPGGWSPNRSRQGRFAVYPARGIYRDGGVKRACCPSLIRPAQLCVATLFVPTDHGVGQLGQSGLVADQGTARQPSCAVADRTWADQRLQPPKREKTTPVRCRPLAMCRGLNCITAKYATLRNRISAAQRCILTSREVSGGGLAHQGHTPSTSGSLPSWSVSRALSSANVRSGPLLACVLAELSPRDQVWMPH
jgi:hypothetical protein